MYYIDNIYSLNMSIKYPQKTKNIWSIKISKALLTAWEDSIFLMDDREQDNYIPFFFLLFEKKCF